MLRVCPSADQKRCLQSIIVLGQCAGANVATSEVREQRLQFIETVQRIDNRCQHLLEVAGLLVQIDAEQAAHLRCDLEQASIKERYHGTRIIFFERLEALADQPLLLRGCCRA